jgi:endonuclease/exonuclease/phosphatase (EEP) superfamily protein YafD
MRKSLTFVVWAYLLGVVVAWLLMRLAGDRWWVATLMLYGPRWLYALPLLVLVPLVLWFRARLAWVLVPSAVVCLFLIGGFCVPWPVRAAADKPSLRVLTFNARGWQGGSDRLRALITKAQPDIVVIQEHRGELPELWPADWHAYRVQSLVIASPHPLQEMRAVHRIPGDRPDALGCEVGTPTGSVRIANVHLFSPRDGLEAVLSRTTILRPSKRHRLQEVTRFRQNQAAELRRFADEQCAAEIIAGDFNMPVDSVLYRRHWGDLQNAFGRVGWGVGYTKRSEIPGMTYGARIDHILMNGAWRPVRCWVGPDVGSDHSPLIADLASR